MPSGTGLDCLTCDWQEYVFGGSAFDGEFAIIPDGHYCNHPDARDAIANSKSNHGQCAKWKSAWWAKTA